MRYILAIGAILAPAIAHSAEERQGKAQVVIDLVSEPSTLDPQLQWNPDSYNVYRNIFDNLLTRDDKGEIVPQIATGWKTLDATHIEFTIRDGVSFQDGTPLTPEDVAFSVNRIIDPKFASPQISQFDKIANAAVSGPHSVVIATNGAYPVLLAQLVKLSIIPRHVVEQVGDKAFNAHPVGSGPYSLLEWRHGIGITLKRNPGYWGTPGVFETAQFRPVPDLSTRVADLQSGRADLAVTLDNDASEQLAQSPTAESHAVLTERIAYFAINSQQPPFTDIRLRQAVAHAIDRQGIVDGILGGHERVLDELVSPASIGYAGGIGFPSFDPDKAKALVRQAGEAARTPVKILTAPVYDQRIVQAIQQELNDVGFNVSIENVEMINLMKQIQSGPATMPALTYGRWSCTCQDADGILYPLLSSKSSWSTLKDAKVDAALDDARSTLDPSRRLADYRQVDAAVAEALPIIPLYQAVSFYGVSRHLQWTPTPNESIFLNRMSWK